jgi:hypothetical protein
MTPKRKADMNRLLRQFDMVANHANCPSCKEYTHFPLIPDYTADLNVLALLEAKLPPHRIEITKFSGDNSYHILYRWSDGSWTKALYGAEAEARAEAIAQYLESRKSK